MQVRGGVVKWGEVGGGNRRKCASWFNNCCTRAGAEMTWNRVKMASGVHMCIDCAPLMFPHVSVHLLSMHDWQGMAKSMQ